MKIMGVSSGYFVSDPGNEVVCDTCGKDFTNRHAQWGIYGLGMKAICPECTPRTPTDAERYGELPAIMARCPEGMTFADRMRNVLRKLP